MCPVCMASAALMVAGVVSTGGLTAVLAKLFRSRTKVKTYGLKNATQRRNDHGYGDDQGGTSESRVAG